MAGLWFLIVDFLDVLRCFDKSNSISLRLHISRLEFQINDFPGVDKQNKSIKLFNASLLNVFDRFNQSGRQYLKC